MATKTIGSAARQYATMQDWFASLPATLTENEVGEMYNDSIFAPTALITFSGKVLNGFTITLRCAAGHSFKDKKNVAGFKLSYQASQGVSVESAAGYLDPMISNEQAGMTIEGIQFKTTAGNSKTVRVYNGSAESAFRDCIMDGNGNTSGRPTALIDFGKAINCLFINRNLGVGVGLQYGAEAINCTVIALNGNTTVCIGKGTSSVLAKNCIAFGTVAFSGTAYAAGSGYNVSSDNTAPGTNPSINRVFADQFVSIVDDFRLKAGSNCIAAGNTDTLYPNDIVGNVRGVGTLGSSGAQEFAGGVTAVNFSGTVPTQNPNVGVAFSLNLSTYFSGTQTPFSYSVFAGTLPAGLTLNTNSGIISGTPTTAGTQAGIVIRATDTTPNVANSNSFSIAVTALANLTSAVFKNNTGSPRVSTIIPFVMVAKLSDASAVATFVNPTTNGSGVLVLSHASFVAGTAYVLTFFNANGTFKGTDLVTAV